LLASLRQSTQLLRLQRGAEHLHWVGSPWNSAALAGLAAVAPLPLPWGGQRRTVELLESRVLDLAVLDLADVEPLDPAPWSSVPLAHYPAALRAALATLQNADCNSPDLETRTGPENGVSLDGDASTVTDVALVLTGHLQRPAIQALITSLRRAYHQAYGHLVGMRWP